MSSRKINTAFRHFVGHSGLIYVLTIALSPISLALTPATVSPTQGVQSETLLKFETRQYAVRIFRQRGILRLNLYNRQTDRVDLRSAAMQQTVTDTGILYANLQGETDYTVRVALDGSVYELKIQQGDRVTYAERVQNLAATDDRQDQDSSSLPNLDPSTIAAFQTRKYAVRIYDQNGELRMNVYNRQTDRVELKAAPVQLHQSGSGTTYTNPSGDSSYAVTVLPVGGYRFVISQRDRVIYNEQGY